MSMKKLVAFMLCLIVFFLQTTQLFSQESEDDLAKKKEEIEKIEAELERVKGEKQTLSSTVAYLDGKITLTETKISQTESQLTKIKAEIIDLTQKIDSLDKSLAEITDLLVNRINHAYKASRVNPLFTVISGQKLNEIFGTYKYLQTVQRNDRQIMYQMESTRLDYNNQKQLKEQKQIELDKLNQQLAAQKLDLDQQHLEKQRLLEVTKNDEKRFQSELAQKRAELEAIQSIIAGKGDETEVGDVDQGASIAKVIPGPSTCSSGAHLHFEVAQNKAHKNPADYLSSKSVIWDNAPDGEFSFNGSWSWPLNDSIRITQGYGMTFYASTMRYYGGAPHTGIDMVNNSDYTVKAAKAGKLFRGAIACRGGTLRYVRVEHEDNISTYYLHVNY